MEEPKPAVGIAKLLQMLVHERELQAGLAGDDGKDPAEYKKALTKFEDATAAAAAYQRKEYEAVRLELSMWLTESKSVRKSSLKTARREPELKDERVFIDHETKHQLALIREAIKILGQRIVEQRRLDPKSRLRR